jgi:hypothetical protein
LNLHSCGTAEIVIGAKIRIADDNQGSDAHIMQATAGTAAPWIGL